MSDQQPADAAGQSGPPTGAGPESAGPHGTGSQQARPARLARAALLAGYGAAAVVTTAVLGGFEPKFPRFVGD